METEFDHAMWQEYWEQEDEDHTGEYDEDDPLAFNRPKRGSGTMREVRWRRYRKPRMLVDILYPIPF